MKLKDSKIDLSVNIGGVKIKNPFFVSSGPTSKHVDQLVKAEQLGWGAVSIKLTFDPFPYISLPPRYGYFNKERFLSFSAETRLNVEEGIQLMKDGRKQTKDLVILANMSYTGEAGIEGWVNMAKRFQDAGAHLIELNMCCPNMSFNVQKSGKAGEPAHRTGASMGEDPVTSVLVTEAVVKGVTIPVVVKLTPEGGRIGQISKAVYEAGAAAVTSVANRLAIPPMDVENPTKSIYHLQEQPSMSCMAGPWIKPLALRDVYEIRKAVGPDRIILGTGGMLTVNDAIEMVMCGADMVGFCAGILLEGFELITPLQKEYVEYMKRHGYNRTRDFRDIIVKNVTANDKLTIYEGHAQKKEECLAAPAWRLARRTSPPTPTCSSWPAANTAKPTTRSSPRTRCRTSAATCAAIPANRSACAASSKRPSASATSSASCLRRPPRKVGSRRGISPRSASRRSPSSAPVLPGFPVPMTLPRRLQGHRLRA